MLNYANLNDVEFEYLCKDIMQKKLGIELHRFAKGRDGGIDLADDAHKKNIVIQVKHYMKTPAAQLIAALKSEVPKVESIAPKEYYVCCSKELSPGKIDEIYKLFSAYMISSKNIITLNEIDDFLNDPSNIDVLKKHYKLWIESTGILQDISNNNIFIDCETLLADIENNERRFVKTSAFNVALQCLCDNKTLFITGNPGVGKTVTSKMLVLYYAANGYRVRFSTNTSDLAELKKSIARDPNVKEIILVDDCFGQAYFKMKESQSEELISLINYVNASPNKLLILNSRITILQEARERKPELIKCFEGKHCKVYILDMTAISFYEKALILYNHISFSGMTKAHFDVIKKERRYYKIIRHPNYTPRIIEFVCNPDWYRDVPPEKYYEFVMQQLNNPKEIWKDEYERKIEKVDRILLQTLYSLSDSAVKEEKVKTCFERRIYFESDIDTTINQYEASLKRLLNGFMKIVSENGEKKLAMVNPSVNDYMDGRLSESELERNKLIDGAVSIQQKKRLLTEKDFEVFARKSLEINDIERFLFDNEQQKKAFVSYYACKNRIFDDVYKSYIYSFLNNPCNLQLYGNEVIYAIKIVKAMFQEDICKYYNICEFIIEKNILSNLLGIFVMDEIFEVIGLIDHLFNDKHRDMFVDVASECLKYAIQEYCMALDAEDFDPDINCAFELARHFNGVCEDIDIEKAEAYITDSIIEQVEDEIYSKLSVLSDDIRHHEKYTDGLTYSIYGVDNMVRSYLEYDECDYEYYRENHREYDGLDADIDSIFDRNLGHC